MSWENLFEDQSIFRRLITLLIPTTFYLDYVLTSLGENELWSLLGLKGLDAAIYQWLHISSHTDVLGVSSRVPSLRIGWFSGNLQPISCKKGKRNLNACFSRRWSGRTAWRSKLEDHLRWRLLNRRRKILHWASFANNKNSAELVNYACSVMSVSMGLL